MKQELLSLVSPAVAVALIAVLGAYFTARAAFADVTLKRRLETAKRFAELAGVVNNLSGGVGVYEQVAAIELLASFGRDEPHLRSAARATLARMAASGAGASEITNAATAALARVPTHDKAIRLWRP